MKSPQRQMARALVPAVLGIGLLLRPAHAARPMRIVSAAPSATEILFELGLGNSLVGVTDSCDYPPQAARIGRIGEFNQPNLEKILALNPTLLILVDASPGSAAQALERAGIRVLNLHIKNFSQLYDGILGIGRATESEARAQALVFRLRDELAAVAARFQTIPPAKLPRVFVEIWPVPLTSAGGASFLSEVIARAGGVSVTRDLSQDYPQINPEDVIHWNPDFILLTTMRPSSRALGELQNRIGWKQIRAVRSHQIIYGISPDYLLRPGPRLVLGIRLLAQRLHPEKEKPDAPQR